MAKFVSSMRIIDLIRNVKLEKGNYKDHTKFIYPSDAQRKYDTNYLNVYLDEKDG